ncbi:MAG: PKD domain-containing protein [Thermoleophilia bacterium]|nr:PKD domain-containing protein [Thermoleophilia bacterium]
MARISHTTRTSRRLAAALAIAGAVAATAGPAAAIPVGGGTGIPPNEPPSAALTGTPNPVVVPTPIIGDISPGRPVATALQLGTLVSYSAAGSADDDGTITKYEWDLDGDGTFEKTTAGATTSRRYSSPGNLTIKLRVTDNDGAKATDTLLLKAHRAPAARITSKKVAVVGEGLSFTSASTDDEGIASLEWDMDGDGTFERTGPQQSTSFGTTGPHKVSLRATDTLGAKSTATVTVRVHRAPTALITTQPPVPVVNQPTVLDGSRSSDDGTIAKYEWDLNGDGTFETSTAAVPRVTTTFTAIGPATVGLRVTDGDGATDQSTLRVQVAATPPATIDSLGPRLRPLARALRISAAGRVPVRIACPASEQVCIVGIQIRGTKGALAGRLLGSGRARLQGGVRVTVPVTMSKKARTSAARRALKARVVLTATDTSGNRAVTRTAVTIRT